MTRDRAVHPDCPNASNPFHICADYCAHGPVRSKNPTNKDILVPNGVEDKETGEKVEGGTRSVDPLCKNASNPFHQYSDHCTQIGHDGKPPSTGFKLEGGKEKVVVADSRKVNSSCPNASNPFHQCAEYCSHRTSNQYKKGNSVGSSKGSTKVVERMGVNPDCLNASNPFHKCAEYCSQNRRINGMVQRSH